MKFHVEKLDRGRYLAKFGKMCGHGHSEALARKELEQRLLWVAENSGVNRNVIDRYGNCYSLSAVSYLGFVIKVYATDGFVCESKELGFITDNDAVTQFEQYFMNHKDEDISLPYRERIAEEELCRWQLEMASGLVQKS